MNDNRFAVIGVQEDGEIFLCHTNVEEDMMLTTFSNANKVVKELSGLYPYICYNVVEVMVKERND